MEEKDQERYERQLRQLKRKGFFMREDGTKSNDPYKESLQRIKKSKSKKMEEQKLSEEA